MGWSVGIRDYERSISVRNWGQINCISSAPFILTVTNCPRTARPSNVKLFASIRNNGFRIAESRRS